MEWIVEANDTEEMADGKFAVISELVRCKDCKHGTPLTKDGRIWCNIHECVWNPDGYCSEGGPKQ